MKRISLLVVALFITGCASVQLSERGRRVEQVTDESKINGCKFLSTVEGSSSLTGVARDQGMKNAINEMTNKAAEAGATHVWYPDTAKGKYWTSSEEVSGKAFDCAQRAISSVPAATSQRQ